MAEERRRMTAREIIIGIVVLIPVFVIVSFGGQALNLGLPQWLLSGIAGLVGVVIWFAVIGRLGGKK